MIDREARGLDRWLLGIVVLLLLASPAAPAGGSGDTLLELVDDRGIAVEQGVEVCFQVELRTECLHPKPGERVRAPQSFFGLRAEGEDHGPVALRRVDLTRLTDGSLRAILPRKALLRVAGAPPKKLTIHLYSPQDPAFREPAFQSTLAPGQRAVKVPAGEFIASLTEPLLAPDLHRLVARPAVPVDLQYRPRKGWSLVARCRTAAGGRAVSGAEVEVKETPGYGLPARALAADSSGRDGLVLFSGLEAAMASLSIRHPEQIPGEVYGLTANPGTFAFRDIALSSGGRLRAHVAVHGRPLAGAWCGIFSLVPDAEGDEQAYRELWAGTADAQGLCRSGRLAAGVYKLGVRPPEGLSQVNRWVSVADGEDRDEEVALAPTKVSGVVRRGGEPTPGYRVQAVLVARDRPKGARGEVWTEATGDENGRYDLTLWAPGRYTFLLRTPSGGIVGGHKELTIEGDEERDLDFDLASGAVRGRVVDEAGRPVEQAWVGLRLEGTFTTKTDSAGNFELDTQGEGPGSLTAGKIGYRDSDELAIRVKADAPIPPVSLVLKRKGTARGTVLSASGNPIAGAWIASVQSSLEAGPRLFQATRSGAEGDFELEVPPGPPQVFVSGPGCPLEAFVLPAEPAVPPPAVHCADAPAAAELTLVDEKGSPLVHAGVILRRNGAIVPQQILATHLRWLGLPTESDGAGRLVLAGLAPGDYDLFLNTLTSESLVLGGRTQGFLTSVSLPALTTTELPVTLPSSGTLEAPR